ncbi:enoyl-CoA hydratase/isomerase family protein [soil metagenome]
MPCYQSYKALQIDVAGPILTVTLNRPPHNPIDDDLDAELSEIFVDINRDPSIKVVVLAAVGRSFSAGGDLDWILQTGRDKDFSGWVRSMRRGRRILMSMLDLDAPIIAKVQGAAVGLGATLALFSDIVVATETATFADPHVKIGLTAGDGGSIIWPHLIGYARAKRHILTGKPIRADQAEAWGLISETAPADALDRVVAELAAEIAGLPFAAVASSKRALNIPLLREVIASMDAHLGLETWSRLSEDHLEAVAAAKDRRPPVFKGR